MRKGSLSLLLSVLVFGVAPTINAQEPTSCVACHSNADLIGDEEMTRIASDFQEDVHAQVGLSCHDCHGGNPDPQLSEDVDAMDPAFPPHPYVGAPKRVDIPAFCGRCHSDPVFMRRFRPDVRVDQEREYWTSHHGLALKRGDTRVATCIDCHGVHGIRKAGDPRAPVYPTRVSQTCGHCHSDATLMAGTKLPNGRPLPTDQLSRWQRSVHAKALLEKGDLTAPTCNDCHGNHGATPPGFDSVAFVCGQCHGREAELFRRSPKHAGFRRHNEYLADAGEGGCAACHQAPEPAATFSAPPQFSECATCHGNHSIIRPTVAMLAPLPAAPCYFCHGGDAADLLPERAETQRLFGEKLSAFLEEAESQGLKGELLFDWLIDRALELPNHSTTASTEEGQQRVLKPEFSRLFEKFRIGKTHFTFTNAQTQEEVTDRVRRCTDCHAERPQVTDEAVGFGVARAQLEHMREVTTATARAERVLGRARRGGVEIREGLNELDLAVDSQIQLEVHVHEFNVDTTSTFLKTQADGSEAARAALAVGHDALRELTTRRRGLVISLVFVGLVLVGLAFRIRQRPA